VYVAFVIDAYARRILGWKVSASIVRVRVHPAELEVELDGSGLAGAAVELASEHPGPCTQLDADGRQIVHFALPDGLPSGAWVLLKRAGSWVDRRFLSWPAGSPDPGVEFAIEPEAQLQALVANGEGSTVEFKQQLPSSPEARRKIARTVAAFANGGDGCILYGVADDGTVPGLDRAESQRAKDAISNFIGDLVTPRPELDDVIVLDTEDDPDRVVLVLPVRQGQMPPYGVLTNGTVIFYVRRGATTSPATADQVRALARSRPPVDTQSAAFPRWRGRT
jgi:hypothetical protein